MMKKISAVWITGIFLALSFLSANAQQSVQSEITPQAIAVAFSKTTNLIFPYAIKSIDKGSRDILVQKATGVENVLQVKAAKPGFAETNLTVVTADGSLYSYVLNFSAQPSSLNIRVDNKAVSPKPIAVFTPEATNDILQSNAGKVLNRQRTINKVHDDNNGVLLALKGLYVQDNELYFLLDLRNYSALNYDVKQLRFFIRDRKKSKRTASQEIDISPLYILGDTRIIRSGSEQVAVVVVPKFTIPDKKTFLVQLGEENGGRNLELSVGNKVIFRALPIH